MTRFSKQILNSVGQAILILYRADHTAKAVSETCIGCNIPRLQVSCVVEMKGQNEVLLAGVTTS